MHNLDLHVNPVNPCKLGGDVDNEKKLALDCVTIPSWFYLLQL